MTISEFQGDFRPLSNFWFVKVIYDHETYPSVEHAYQAAKTHDLIHRSFIQQLQTPGLAKREGRKVVLREDWKQIKVFVMRSLLWQKFQRSDLKRLLLSTGDQELIEGNNWHDNFWGKCRCYTCHIAYEQGMIDDFNNLGRLLMETRTKLREQ